jgi:hypothetical protein
VKRLLVIVLLAAACSAPAGDVAAPTTGTPDGPSPAGGGAQQTETADGVPAALDWSVDRLGGGQIDGGDLAGRDVVLWFWAPW